MFTGIVEEVGEVRRASRRGDIHLLTISARIALHEMALGDSISVSGVCLTVVEFGTTSFTVEATPETMSATTLEELAPGSRVNIERAMRLGGKMGGHMVSGHVDGTGEIAAIDKQGESYVMAFRAPLHIMRYVVPKGSVAVDGISLTIVDTQDDRFSVAVIPFTYRDTIISLKRLGSRVNIECDIIGKYVERFVSTYAAEDNLNTGKKSKIDRQFLSSQGFM